MTYLKKAKAIHGRLTLLNAMLCASGITSQIVLTNSHGNGGFDSSFVSFQYLQTPLLVSTVKGKTYCTFPENKSALFGQYPVSFLDLKGLNLNTKKIVRLPPPIFHVYKENRTLKIDLTRHASQHFHTVFLDFFAYEVS